MSHGEAQRVVEVLGALPGVSGSGYLIGPDLVLTAAHLTAGTCRVRRSTQGTGWLAERIWSGLDAGLDAALLKVTGAGWPAVESPAARFGRLTTDRAAEVWAHGFPGGQSGPVALAGTVPEGIPVDNLSYPVRVADRNAPWDGMSGAALCCASGLVLGVVIHGTGTMRYGRVAAVPAHRLLAADGFGPAVASVTGHDPYLESAELAPLLAEDSVRPRSPASLLRAHTRAVRFSGRDDVLRRLRDWCRGDGFAMLLHGPGGEGKTRLAAELVSELRADQANRWVGGFVAGLDRLDDRSRAALAGGPVPLVLVVDGADVWSESDLLDLVQHARPAAGATVRLLLLARSAGEWWDAIRSKGRLFGAGDERLTPWPVTGEAVQSVVGQLRAAARGMPGYRGVGRPSPGSAVTVEPATGESAGHALAIHLAALRAALGPLPVPAHDEPPDAGAIRLPWPRPRRGGPEPRAASVDEALLRWEADYWSRTLPAGLGLPLPALREAVAAATLFGAGNQEEADRVIAALPSLAGQPTLAAPLRGWLEGLYPGSPKGGWRPLEPERLGEYLVATEVLGSAAFTRFVATQAPRVSERQRRRMLIVLARAAAWHPELDDIVSGLVVSLVAADRSHVRLVAEVAARLQRPDPLLDGLSKLLLSRDRDSTELSTLFRTAALGAPGEVHFEPAERYPRALARWAADLVGGLPEETSGDRASLYTELSDWLTAAGMRGDGVAAAQQAVNLYRLLVTDGRNEFVEHLATALTDLCLRLGDLGSQPEAVRMAEEAAALRRGLVAAGRDDVRRHLAWSLRVLAVRLFEADRAAEGRVVAEEAVRRYEELVPADASGLASARLTLGMCLGRAGQQDRALQERALAEVKTAVKIRRDLAEREPTTTTMAGLACALSVLSVRYEKLDHLAEGRQAADGAVEKYRALAALRWDEFAPGLACALSNLGVLRGKLEEYPEGAQAALEAIVIRRELARQRPGAVERMLAKSLATYGWLLVAQGRAVDAVQPLAEAWSLAQKHGTGIADFVTEQLGKAYQKAPLDVAAAWRRATGDEWPRAEPRQAASPEGLARV